MRISDYLEKTKDESSVWLSYTMQRKQVNSPSLFCFYEGEDGKYYRPRIKKYFANVNIVPFICKGRTQVMKVYQKLKQEGEDFSSLLLFIDKDFEPIKTCDYPEIYQTPYHSLENFYTDNNVITHILEDRMQFLPIDSSRIVELYKELHQKFVELYRKVSLWYVACSIESFPLDLKNYKVKAHLKIENNQLVLKQISSWSLKEIGEFFKKHCDNLIDDYKAKFDDILRRASNLDPEFDGLTNIRGKFDLEFLSVLVEYIDFQNKTNKLSMKYEMVKVSKLFESDPLSDLSSYAATPDNLITYIKGHKPFSI